MTEVTVVVGPRASGKSSFCERVIALDPSFILVSRDKILVKLFGKADLDPYTGEHEFVEEKMWKLVEQHMGAPSDIKLILDTWNGSSRDRNNINQKLRKLGAGRINAWYFVTPVEHVEEWFWKKPGIAKMKEMRARQGQGLTFYYEDAPIRDHDIFHKLALAIDSDGFDEVVRINPIIMGPEHVLKLQTSLDL